MVFDCSRDRCPKYFSDVYIPVHTVTARSRLRSADHGNLVVPRVLSRFDCRSFRVSGPTIWNDLPVDIRSTDITREQFKRSLKIWLFAYGRRRVWETVQSEGAPKKWTYLLTYLACNRVMHTVPVAQTCALSPSRDMKSFSQRLLRGESIFHTHTHTRTHTRCAGSNRNTKIVFKVKDQGQICPFYYFKITIRYVTT